MCGRFTLTVTDWEELTRVLGVDPASVGTASASYRPRFNVAPTDAHWIVHDGAHGKEIAGATWGLGGGSHGKLQINARVESPSVRGRLRDPGKHARCVVVADGFYEWMGSKGDRTPVWFHPPEKGLMLLGGICAPSSSGGIKFAVLTTAANDVVARLHDRMPVIVPTNAVDRFLHANEAEIAPMLLPLPNDAIVGEVVSRRVNAVANDDPSVLVRDAEAAPKEAPVGKKGNKKQLGLFGK